MTRHARTRLLTLVPVLGLGSVAAAADVSLEVSSGEVYVEMPFVISISIDNADEFDPPAMPEIDGLRIGPPQESTSSFVSSVNGRVSRRETVTLNYQCVAVRDGVFEIPPIAVVADGEVHLTRAVRLSAVRSETGNLLLVDVRADRETYYVGERIDLTLEIWLKPYRDPDLGVQLDAHDMVECLTRRGSNWGVFESGLDGNRITVRNDRRRDDEGVLRSYLVYLIPGTMIPRHAGTIGFDDVRIVVNYPTQVRRSRSFFDRGRWEVVRSRPLVASPKQAPIEIKPPPEEGRPGSFDGAVGRFDLDVTARPTSVAVGDPITLTLAVTDRSDRGAELDLLMPPPLERVPELAARFRVPTDPLAGLVEGRRKTFTQTIRATDESVTQIPPIPFSFFDPDAQRYVTVYSEAIPIEVAPAATLTVSEIVGGNADNGGGPTELTEVAGGILANDTGADLLATRPPFAISAAHYAALAAPPVLFAVFAVGRRQAERRRGAGQRRRRNARRRALGRLREAGSSPAEQVAMTAAALSDYVADRCNLPAGALTSEEALGRLERCGVPETLRSEVAAVLAACEAMRYAGRGVDDSDSIGARAARCIEQLERTRLA